MERISASVAEARDRAATHRSAAAVVPPIQVSNQPAVAVMLMMVSYRCTLLQLLPHHKANSLNAHASAPRACVRRSS